jgi:CBS domain-containing protein
MGTVQEILRSKGDRPVHSIGHHETVLAAIGVMNRHSIGAIVVTEGSRMAGIFTERDVLRRVIGEERSPATTPIADVMTRDVVICAPDTTIDDVRSIMKQRRVRHVPVIDEAGNVAGLISIGDLNAWHLNHQEVEIHYLNEYLHGRV